MVIENQSVNIAQIINIRNKNKNIDTQCKICKKPTLYKKCIACSTCEHFYHGKCLDLNKDDIEKIERICNFYMCLKCNTSILPQLDIKQKKPKQIPKLNFNLRGQGGVRGRFSLFD